MFCKLIAGYYDCLSLFVPRQYLQFIHARALQICVFFSMEKEPFLLLSPSHTHAHSLSSLFSLLKKTKKSNLAFTNNKTLSVRSENETRMCKALNVRVRSRMTKTIFFSFKSCLFLSLAAAASQNTPCYNTRLGKEKHIFTGSSLKKRECYNIITAQRL